MSRDWADRAPAIRPRGAMQTAREVLGGWLREDGEGRLRLCRDGVWVPVTVHQVIAAADAVRQRQYRRDALRRARQVVGDRLVVAIVDGRDMVRLDGKIASLARVVEVGQQLDRSGWPSEPAELVYPGGGL